MLDVEDMVALDSTCKALREPLAQPILVLAQAYVEELKEDQKELDRESPGGHEDYECANQSGDSICDRCDEESEHRNQVDDVEFRLDRALACVQAKLAMIERRKQQIAAAAALGSVKRRRN